MELLETLHDINNISFTTKTAEARVEKEAELNKKKEELISRIDLLSEQEPSMLMPSIEEVKKLAKNKSLDNDELCKLLKETTKKTWTWSLRYKPLSDTSKNHYYGIIFKQGDFELNCFFGSTSNVKIAREANEKLKNINWFEPITDIEEREECNYRPTCFAVPKEFRKTVLTGLAKQCEKPRDLA